MRVLVQRVSEASVRVDGEIVGAIDRGLLLFVGVSADDGEPEIVRLVNKIVHLRIFDDPDGRMNLSAVDLGARAPGGVGMLVVSQFTLYADVRRGRKRRDSGSSVEYSALRWPFTSTTMARSRFWSIATTCGLREFRVRASEERLHSGDEQAFAPGRPRGTRSTATDPGRWIGRRHAGMAPAPSRLAECRDILRTARRAGKDAPATGYVPDRSSIHPHSRRFAGLAPGDRECRFRWRDARSGGSDGRTGRRRSNAGVRTGACPGPGRTGGHRRSFSGTRGANRSARTRAGRALSGGRDGDCSLP